MKKIKLLTLCIFILLLKCQLYSQGNLVLSIGPSFPMEDFGDDDIYDDDSGLAGLGLGAGLSYTYALTETGLGLYGSIDIAINAISKDAIDDLEDFYTDYYGENTDISRSKYINIPVSAGLSYNFEANENIGLFGKLGLSYNTLKKTQLTIEARGFNDLEETFEIASSFGINIGGGIVINDNIEIGLKYFSLGEFDIEVEQESGSNKNEYDFDLDVALFLLTVGFRI